MSPRYIRTRPAPGQVVGAVLVAGAVAAGVGLVTFYLMRLMWSRETLASDRREALARASQSEA